MPVKSPIEWTEATWNPVRGCSPVSPGCKNCYAERMAARNLPGMQSRTTGEPFAIMDIHHDPHWTGKVELIPHMLDIPVRRRVPTTYFVNSMSDLFHESLPDEEIDQVTSIMSGCRKHTYQVLTKRSERLPRYFGRFRPDGRGWVTPGGIDGELTHCPIDANRWPIPNLWLGVSVEDRARLKRIDHLRATPAAVRFLSLEPLLEDLGTLDLTGIDWVIVGGESGPGARRCDIAWIRAVVEQCKAANVPCFVKQWGSRPVYKDGQWDAWPQLTDRKGGDPEEWPAEIRVRQMLEVRP